MSSVTWLGHSTVLIDLDGVKLVTDPVLRPRVAHLRRAWAADHAALRGVDAVLVSHLHYDHRDLPSLERLGRTLPVVLPRGAAGLLRRRGLTQVLELGIGEELRIGALTVRATYAEHDGSRGLPWAPTAPALGFVVEGSRSVYFAGDTDLFAEMEQVHGTLDVALVPIWGWGPSMGPGHMGPEEAARALALLRPRAAVPIHWGTYFPLHLSKGRAGFLHEPLDAFLQASAERAPGVAVHALDPNGRLPL